MESFKNHQSKVLVAHSPKARPPIAAASAPAIIPVELTLKPKPAAPTESSGNKPGSPEPETSPPSLDEVEVAVGAAELVDSVTGSDEAFKEVAEYGAEKV